MRTRTVVNLRLSQAEVPLRDASVGARSGSLAPYMNLAPHMNLAPPMDPSGREELLRHLTAENAELRKKAVDLALQIQALRERAMLN
jgi:hypothetical protein